jgi:hypothetical protein
MMIFKGFFFHHMAPMAGSVSYGKKYGLIFCFCSYKSFLRPGIPIHRVVGMLKEIGALLMDQTIGGAHSNLLMMSDISNISWLISKRSHI